MVDRKIHVTQLKEGDEFAAPVYEGSRLLLQAGMRACAETGELLLARGIEHVFVRIPPGPALQESAAGADAGHPTPSQRKRREQHASCVLIADDDENIRTVMRYMLEGEGYRVLEAREGTEALRLVRQERIDLILLDSMMGPGTGTWTCQQLKSDHRTANIPVITCSACSKEEVISSMEAGAVDYILKPFRKETLLDKVKRAMDAQPQPARQGDVWDSVQDPGTRRTEKKLRETADGG